MARRTRWGRWGVVAALGAAGLGTVALWRSPPVSVETVRIAPGRVAVEVVEDGRTRVIDRYLVSSPVPASLTRIGLRPGDPVEADQVVALLSPAPSALLDPRTRAEAEARRLAATDARRRAVAAIAAAEVSADLARRESERVAALGEHASRQQIDQAASVALLRAQELASARFAADVAGHEIDLADALLGRRAGSVEELPLVSPVRGVVLAVLQESEGVIAPGTPLLEIGDPSGLEVVVDLLTPDAVAIRPGARAELERWGGTPLAGHVYRIEPKAFTRLSALGVEEQRVNVVVRIDSDRSAWAALGDGFRIEARIGVDERDGVLVVPESAVIRSGGRAAVFRADRGRARLAPVELGLRNGVDAEVLGGLAEGEAVVLHPSDAVADGVRVR